MPWFVAVRRPSHGAEVGDDVECLSLAQGEEVLADAMARETEIGTSLLLYQGRVDIVRFYLTPTGWRRAEKMPLHEDLWLWSGAAAKGISLRQYELGNYHPNPRRSR